MFAARDDAGAFGEVLRHDQGRPAAGGERIADLVHERLHIKDAPPTCFHEVFRAERVADLLGIEALAFVGDVDGQLRPVQVERGVHFLADVELVAVLDGVRDGLAHGHADPMRAVLVETCVLTQMLRNHLNQLDVLEAAADGDLDTLAVTVLHRWKPRAFYGTPASPATAEWGAGEAGSRAHVSPPDAVPGRAPPHRHGIAPARRAVAAARVEARGRAHPRSQIRARHPPRRHRPRRAAGPPAHADGQVD